MMKISKQGDLSRVRVSLPGASVTVDLLWSREGQVWCRAVRELWIATPAHEDAATLLLSSLDAFGPAAGAAVQLETLRDGLRLVQDTIRQDHA